MLIQPEVNIQEANGDVYVLIDLCIQALRTQGIENHEESLYEQAITALKKDVLESKAEIRTLAILANYCQIIPKE